jgi:hypothetical protein
MRELEIWPAKIPGGNLKRYVGRRLMTLPKDSIVKLRLCGEIPSESMPHLRAAALRSLAPPTMNVEVQFPREYRLARYSK